MLLTPECLNIPLTNVEKLEIIGDYMIPTIGISTIIIFVNKDILYPRTIYYLLNGILLCVPFEFLQPKLGWVSYFKCETYQLAPVNIMWIVHSCWDSLILLIIYFLSSCLFKIKKWNPSTINISLLMGILCMVQEIFIESHETLWYYTPTTWNPQWATINGRPMTLQQWHWAVLPYFYLLLNK